MAEVEKDDLLADVRAAAEGLESGIAEVVETPARAEPAGETDQQKADRVRDEAGRFAKAEEGKPRETLKLKEPKEPVAAGGKQEGAVNPETVGEKSPATPAEQGKPIEGLEIPPVNWKGDAKVKWGALPAPVRAEIVAQHERVAAVEAEFAPLNQAIAPYRDTLVRDAGSVENGIGQLMTFYKLFLENPQGLIQHIARTRGIDLGQPAGQPAQAGTSQTPDINSLIAQTVQQAIAPIQERFKQTETQQLEQTVAEFAADPRYPYFQDVKVQMGQLMQAGLARNMPEAYDKAVRLTPAIWSTLEQQRTEDAQKAQVAEAEKARKAAAASLRGSPLPNGHAGGGAGQNASVLDDVRAADAELSGA